MKTPTHVKKTFRKVAVAAVAFGAGLVSETVQAYDIRLEYPNVWYSFDSEAANEAYRSLGAASLTFSACPKAYEASPNGQAMAGTGIAYGPNFPYGPGDWTVVVRLKAKQATATTQTYPILLCFGRSYDNTTKDTLGLYMDGKTSGKMRWAMTHGKAFTTGQIIDFDVATANTAYHTYAAIYRSATQKVDVYCDGVKKGTLSWTTCNANNANWCWYTGSGGVPSGSEVGYGGSANHPSMDDFRQYQRALSDSELLGLHNHLDSGSIYGGPLGTASRVVWKNVKLADIKKFHALTFSASFSVANGNLGVPWTAYVVSRTETQADVQFQFGEIRWVRVTFTQNGADVAASIPEKGVGYGSFAAGVDVTTQTATATWDPLSSTYTYNVLGLTYDKFGRADDTASSYTWHAAEGAVASVAANWRRYWVSPSALATAKLCLPHGDGLRHTMTVRNACTLGDVAVDGHYAFTREAGGLYCRTLDMGATGRLEFDPAFVSLRLGTAPTLAEGAKFALPAAYANATRGKFLVMSWETGTFPAERLADFFDATSCAAANPVLTVDAEKGFLWLTLDPSAQPTAVSIFSVGDSITDGMGVVPNFTTVFPDPERPAPTWRLPLMKKLTARGYEPTALGFRVNNYRDAAGTPLPEEWRAHAGVCGQCAFTSGNQPGIVDTIYPTLEQAGVPDVMVLLIGINNISGGCSAAHLYDEWKKIIDRAIAFRPTTKIVCGSVIYCNYNDPEKEAVVRDFNALMRAQIEKSAGAEGAFPANQVYLADTYTQTYGVMNRSVTTDAYTTDGVHPDWRGHDLMAECFADAIERAMADPRPVGTVVTNTATGAEANVPAAYRNGFTLCRTLHVPATGNFPVDQPPPYDPVDDTMTGATTSVDRVAYYVELKRKGRDHRRFVWADMDAFGDRTLDTMGVPTRSASAWQGLAQRLHVFSNDPSVTNVDVTNDTVNAWLEFWPNMSTNSACGLSGAPAKRSGGLDWNDTKAEGWRGSMQVHRICAPGETFVAQTVFAFNGFCTGANDPFEIGFGTFPQEYYWVEKRLLYGNSNTPGVYLSFDWSWTQETPALSSEAYDEIIIQIWTKFDPGKPVAATWTGAVSADPATAANWDCRNALNEPLEEAIPTGETVVTLPNGCTNSFPVGGAFLAREVKLPATIGANLDWSGITAPLSGTLDLQGNTLTLSQLTGDAEITDTTDLEYDLLDSITSDQSKAQYIKTGMIVADYVKYELDFGKYIYPKGVSNLMLLGLDSGNYYGFGLCHQNKYNNTDKEEPWFLFSGPNNDSRFFLARTEGHNYRLTVDAQDITTTGNGSVTLADTTPGSSDTVTRANIAKMTLLGTTDKLPSLNVTGTGVTNRELALFGRNTGGSCTSFTFYRFWFKEASGTEHTFVPVRQRSTGKCGILDLTTKTFCGNANTAAASGDFTPGAVTNYLLTAGATGTPGTLHVNVAAGTTVNSTVTLSGALKLVKEGSGTFVAQKKEQTYVGGTEVLGGTFKLYNDKATPYTATDRVLGALGSAVEIGPQGTVEISSTPGLYNYNFVLSGGKLSNNNITETSNFSDSSENSLGAVTLTADSSAVASRQLVFATGALDLGGHTLELSFENASKTVYFHGSGQTVRNGTITIKGGTGASVFYDVLFENGDLDMRTASLDMVTAYLVLKSNLSVSNYIARASYRSATLDNNRSVYNLSNPGDMSVYGAFQPWNDFFYGCTLKDGATLDLSKQANTWSVTSAGANPKKTVTFAENATVTVKLGGRTVKNGQIVTWADATVKPDDSVTFVLDPVLNARLVRKPDGLWLQTGLMIQIR